MKFKAQRKQRYDILRENHFTVQEAREFSVLPKKTPALQAMIADRNRRWNRFAVTAQHKVQRGSWRVSMIDAKWKLNLKRYYKKNNWIVEEGPKGKQKGPMKGSPSPWAAYREYERTYPGKDYVSPWELKKIKGKTVFDRGQIFLSKAEKNSVSPGADTLKYWISQLGNSINMAKGKQKQQFMKQRERLQEILNEQW